ncbi:hypothetical protein Tco_0481349 [Tanacetum coccineum]
MKASSTFDKILFTLTILEFKWEEFKRLTLSFPLLTMSNLEFVIHHKMVTYLKEKLKEVKSFIKKFWQTASASTLEDGEVGIIATIDGQLKTITKASLRRHIKLEDADGISSLPNIEIFEQLALMGTTLRQETKVPQPSSPSQTHDADEAASTRVDVKLGGAATTVSSLDAG